MSYTYKTYPTACIHLDARTYTRQQLQDAIEWIDSINAQNQRAMQPKEWVGLTDDEKAYSNTDYLRKNAEAWHGGVAWAEAKLKEKNA
jgi:hypothetical protein